MSSFCQIACRGVSHTPESVHVGKLVHPGVCDYAIRPYIGYLRYTQCGKKMCRSSLYLHGNIFIK